MKIDKNTKFSWLTEEVRSEDSIRHELVGILSLSFIVALIIVIMGFLLLS
ncbi:MAG: hypothetical protein AAGA64_03780 [Bacteroidota bacterium]